MIRALIAALLIATPAHANDKALHALAGVAIYGATGSLGACVAAGVAKEAWDSTGRGTVEAADAVATILPCLLMHLIRSQRGPVERNEPRPVDRAGLIEWANGR